MWNGHDGISNSQSKGRVSDNVTPLYSIDILGYRVIDLKTELEEIRDLAQGGYSGLQVTGMIEGFFWV